MVINSPFFPEFQTKLSAGLLPHHVVFQHMGIVCFCTFQNSFLKSFQSLCTPLPLQDWLSRDSLSQSPKKAKVCPPEVHISSSPYSPPYFSKKWKLSFHDLYAQGGLQPPTSPSLFANSRSILGKYFLYRCCISSGWEDMSGVSTHQFARFQAHFNIFGKMVKFLSFQHKEKMASRGKD